MKEKAKELKILLDTPLLEQIKNDTPAFSVLLLTIGVFVCIVLICALFGFLYCKLAAGTRQNMLNNAYMSGKMIRRFPDMAFSRLDLSQLDRGMDAHDNQLRMNPVNSPRGSFSSIHEDCHI